MSGGMLCQVIGEILIFLGAFGVSAPRVSLPWLGLGLFFLPTILR